MKTISFLYPKSDDLKIFERFTYPEYRRRLEAGFEFTSVAAVAGGILPVGLVLASIGQKEPEEARILSLYVAPGYRRRGIGKTLLSMALAELRKKEVVRVSLIFNFDTDPAGPCMKRILASGGWSEPTERYWLFKVDVPALLAGPGFRRLTSLEAEEFELFMLSDLKPEDQGAFDQAIEGIERDDWKGFNPFHYLDVMEPSSSVGFRNEAGYAGWVITTRNGPGSLGYAALYVRREYRMTALAMRLMAKALTLQAEAGFAEATCIINIENTRMLNMFRRRFGSALIKEMKSGMAYIEL